MKLPALMLSAAALFWGWQTAHWWIGAVLVALFEAPRLMDLRVNLSALELKRIAITCLGLLVVLIVFLFLRPLVASAILEAIRWAPLVLAPYILALIYSGTQQVHLGALWSVPAQAASAPSDPFVNLGYPYFALLLLSASVANTAGPGFFIGITFLCSLALWSNRPGDRAPLVWGSFLCIALLGGGSVSLGLHHFQGVLENAAEDWFRGQGEPDPGMTQTSLGHIGKLTLSSEIVLRAVPGQKQPKPRVPLLLMTASYNTFSSPDWRANGGNVFKTINPEEPSALEYGSWRLKANSPDGAGDETRLKLSARSTTAAALLALPKGATGLSSREIHQLKRNGFGTIQGEITDRNYSYEVSYNSRTNEEPLPGAADLALPERDAVLIKNLAAELHLVGQPPEKVLALVKAYFVENFTYNLWRSGNAPNQTAMEDFLVQKRSGHCEHFATATVLLLRAAAIPARYAIGYSVQEPSFFGSGYVARQRDAHAWTRVYLNGGWLDFDTTPPDWSSLAAKNSSILQPLLDVWSWLLFEVRALNSAGYPPLAYALGALAIFSVSRKLLRRKAQFRWVLFARKRSPQTSGAPETRSDFALIEQSLAARGLARASHEPIKIWLVRISSEIGTSATVQLREIATLYYCHRFGPPPLPQEQQLRWLCHDWLAKFGQNKAHHEG